LAGEVKGFDLCLASEDLADKIKPLQKKLRKLMPTSRRGQSFTDSSNVTV